MLRGRKNTEASLQSAAMDAEVSDLRASHTDLLSTVQSMKDTQRETTDLLRAEVQRLEQEILRRAALQEEALAASEQRRDELSGQQQACEAGLRQLAQDLEGVWQGVEETRSEASRAAAAAQEQSRAAADGLRASLDAASAALSDALRAAEARLEERCAAQAAKAEADVNAAVSGAGARCEALQGALDEVSSSLGELRATVRAAQDDQASAVEAALRELRGELKQELLDAMQEAEAQRAASAEEMERVLDEQRVALARATTVVENTFTRSVVWQARGFKRRLAQLLESSDQVIASPAFSVSCLPEMRLEVQLASGDSSPDAAPALPLPGLCSVGLWAPPGLRLTFRLTLGEGPDAVSRQVEHCFQPGGQTDDEGRVLCLAPHFCQLDRVWVRQGDVIRVAFELLEFQCPPVAAGGLTFGAGLEEPAGEGASEAGEEIEDAEEAEQEPEIVTVTPQADIVSLMRTLTTQELIHERLSSELAAVKNRSVRRVEWMLQGCARLLECRVGEAIDSPVFSAAGLERIQFHFYPRDTSATGTNSQPCGLYVSGPSRTSLKGMLWVGSTSRQFEHRYQRRGDTAGRGRFCLLEHQVDCSDCVTLAFDIGEVEADLPDQDGASLCLRDARQQGPGKAPAPAAGAAPLSGTRGLLRMKRGDPSKTEEFVKCVSLPTLNARQLKLPLALKGARNF